MEFRSQVGQDAWVCKKLGNMRDGFFLDIGAGDGIEISNTYYLEKELGWTGICVEANPDGYVLLIQDRDCACHLSAIYSYNGVVNFATTKKNGIWGVRECLQEDIRSTDIEPVNAITLSRLLDIYTTPKVIDYISIDVEGADYEALLGFPFDTHEAKLWTIEHNAYLDGGVLKAKIRKLMAEKGYELTSEEDKSDWANIFEDWFINPKYITQ